MGDVGVLLVVAAPVSRCAVPTEATLKGSTKFKVALLDPVLDIYGSSVRGRRQC